MTAAVLAGWILRGWSFVLFAAVVGLAVGLALIQLATPRFTASTDLVISPSNLRVVENDLYAANLQSDSQLLDVESKMRVITSTNVLRRVLAKLTPEDVAEFAAKPALAELRAFFGLPRHEADSPSTTALATDLAERIKVSRQERSYVVTVSVWTSEADLSARVANAVAQAFKDEVSQADADRAGLAAQSITGRLSILKESVTEAETKVEVFRREHGLQQGAGGQLVDKQAIDRMSLKLTDARARLAEAEAHDSEVERASRGSGPEAAAMDSPTLTALRSDQTGLRRQIASQSQSYGPRYPALANLRMELEATTRAIQTETQRLRRAARLDVDQARRSLGTLANDVMTLRGSVSDDDRDQVKLRELERDASTKIALYQASLTRAGEATERQQVDATDVRVISEAVPPQRANWPPRPIVALPGGVVAGLVLGVIVTALWGYLGAWRRIRTGFA